MIVRDAADLGALLREARRERGLSQSQVAEMIGATRQWVISTEQGAPTAQVHFVLDALHAVGLVLDVSPELVPSVDATALSHLIATSRRHG
ncbi:MAG: helix-turn-helix domain-containing protein [Nocardioidaceae bacterium]